MYCICPGMSRRVLDFISLSHVLDGSATNHCFSRKVLRRINKYIK